MRTATKLSALALGILAFPLAEASPESLLKKLGLKPGLPYVSAKAQLIGRGWKVDSEYVTLSSDNKPSPYGFTEVVCGNGWDAICSARFLRDDQKVMLTLRPKKALVVDGAWNDN